MFYQDNDSAMKIEKNRRKACGEKPRHVHMRYYFIKDIVVKKHIELIHCPIENIIADFYTNPLQGVMFRK